MLQQQMASNLKIRAISTSRTAHMDLGTPQGSNYLSGSPLTRLHPFCGSVSMGDLPSHRDRKREEAWRIRLARKFFPLDVTSHSQCTARTIT